MTSKHAATTAVDAIILDLSDRRGLRQEWEGIDSDIRRRIRRTWIALVDAAYTSPEQAGEERR